MRKDLYLLQNTKTGIHIVPLVKAKLDSIQKSGRFDFKLFIVLVFILFGGLLNAQTDRYWSGGSGSSDNIDQGNNWYGGINPSAGDNLYFNNTITRHWAYSNYGGGSYFNFLITYNGAGGIKFYGDNTYAKKFENNSDGSLLELSPSSAAVGSREIGNRIDNDLEINPVGLGGILVSCDKISIDNTNGARTLKVYGGNTLTINGFIYEKNGAGGAMLHIIGAANVILKGNSTYTGTTTISAGTLELQGNLASSAIIVESGATLKINGNGVTINGLTVNSGGFVEIMPGKSLTINGALANSGTFTINSDDTGTGSLITNSTVSGNVTVERYISGWGSATEGWHLLSSPVSNQTFPSFTTGSTGNYDFYFWRETTNEWVNYKAEAGSFGSTFVSGQGYLASYENTATKQFTGTLNNSDVPFPLTYTSTSGRKGYNLLGNPYPSGVVWNVTTWKPDNTTINGVAKVLSSSTAAYIDITAGTTIPAMNGFFVYTTAATTLTIPATAKTHGGTWYKNTNETQKLTLTAVDIDGQTAQQSNIMIQPESSFDFDLLYDGEFSPFYAPSFYSFVNNFAYSTNAIPYVGENTVIPFQFIKNDGTNFRIDAEGVDQMGQSVMLLDKLTGVVTDLSQSNSYSFTATGNDDPNRFEIHFGVVGINESNNENSLNAYVYGDRLYVMNTSGKASLQLFDLQGRLVQSNVLNGTGLQSQSVNLPAGVYIVRVNDEKSVKSVKLVIE